jgi:hypothetical protein
LCHALFRTVEIIRILDVHEDVIRRDCTLSAINKRILPTMELRVKLPSLWQAVEVHRLSRLSQFLDNRLTDGAEVVNLTRRSYFTPLEGLRKWKRKSYDLLGNRTLALEIW